MLGRVPRSLPRPVRAKEEVKKKKVKKRDEDQKKRYQVPDSEEWKTLNEANAASAQQVEELSNQLAAMGSKLLQSFEMQSVLAQLQKTVNAETDRTAALREASCMASEEVHQRRREAIEAFQARERAEAAKGTEKIRETELTDTEKDRQRDPRDPRVKENVENLEASPSAASPLASPLAALPSAIDWDRLLSERETTAAALSAGLQRLSSLQKEVQELQEERCRAEGDHQDLRPLRNRLRNCVEAEAKAAEPFEVLAASEGLFRRRANDLAQQLRELRQELRLAKEGEKTLRRSVTARSHALQGLLHRAALSGLALPQCGPVRLAPDPDAERAALLAAVQDYFHFHAIFV
eukprot:symbB.v1.2.028039.t1/scaffold2927.1/size67078/6